MLSSRHDSCHQGVVRGVLDNPLLNAAVTFTEPFLVGLLITLISAAMQKKRTTGDGLADESGYGTAQARTSDAN